MGPRNNDGKEDADRYSKVAENNNAVVTVDAQSGEEAQRAADILNDCGAIDKRRDDDHNTRRS